MEDPVHIALTNCMVARLREHGIAYRMDNLKLVRSAAIALWEKQRRGVVTFTYREIIQLIEAPRGKRDAILSNLALIGFVRGQGTPRSEGHFPIYDLCIPSPMEDGAFPEGFPTATFPDVPPALAGQLMEGFQSELMLLARWIESHPEPPDQVHINERSFEIFNDEKYLSLGGGEPLLEHLGVSLGRLGISASRSGFLLTMAPCLPPCPTVLLVENHASYDSLAHLLYKRRSSLNIAGARIDGVLHSNGYAVKCIERLEGYIASFVGDSFNLLYWGDIDHDGIWELQRAQEGAMHELRPFQPLYERSIAVMRERLRAGCSVQKGSAKARACDVERFVEGFSEDDADFVRLMLLQHLLVPQEILSRSEIESMLEPRGRVPGVRFILRAFHAAGVVRGLAAELSAVRRQRRCARIEA